MKLNKKFRFLFFSPLLIFLLLIFFINQDTSADGSIDDEMKAIELRKKLAEKKVAEQKTIKVIRSESGEDEEAAGEGEEGEFEEDQLPDWIKPVRWFRSNAAGMALEEVLSRFTALRNEYALAIDFINADELPEVLEPYFAGDQYIEVRALYRNGQESRRQWIFRDKDGTNRVVAVLRELEKTEKADLIVRDPLNVPLSVMVDEPIINEETIDDEIIEDDNLLLDIVAIENEESEEAEETELLAAEEAPPALPLFTGKILVGFVELYNENEWLVKDIIFSGHDGEQHVNYFYRNETLVRAEFSEKKIENGVQQTSKLFTDDYRYNRSGSLRFVERLYHQQTDDPVRLSFPSRILDAVKMDFFAEKLYIAPEFFGGFTAMPDQRLVFGTDARGRVLTQTLFDEEGEAIWTIVNNWKGDRITSAVKTQGDDIWLVEYEYDFGGKRLVERDLRNGILERQVRAQGKTEVEELMMDGVVVLRAVWEDGRKISEERIRNRRERAQ